VPTPVYSRAFIIQPGLTGETTLDVPEGHVYVVRTISAYTNPPVDATPRLFFMDSFTNATLWYAEAGFDAVGAPKATYAQFEGRLVFGPQTQMKLSVGGQGPVRWDVSVHGYDLTLP
jgi:hypothetical protein